MAEQLMFGLDTLYELRAMMASYYSHFNDSDVGTVILVIAVVTLVQSLLLAVLAGGRWRLSVAGLFGIMGVVESHHLVQTILFGGYFPGVVTSIAYVWIGVMILRTVIRGWSGAAHSANQRMALA
jgi:hypothetical protein